MNRREFLTACGLAAAPLVQPLWARAGIHTNSPMTSKKPRIWHEKIRLELSHRWTIARGSADYKENVFVYYRREGVTGLGEAGHLTAAGQTAEQTQQGLDKLIPLYEDADPWAFRNLEEEARRLPGVTAPALAALEMALWDWLGKKLGIPLYQWFGLDPHKRVPTSYTIGLDSREVMQQKTREAGAFHLFKVKLGREDDEAIIRALRAVTDKPIRVDANEGWPDKETALRRIEWLARQGIELVEQPLPRRLIEETRWLKERTVMPIIADESVAVAKDIPALAGAFTGINIKLMKAGGIGEALRMFTVAKAHGLDTMLGCMVESSVGISAAAQLQSLARWVDLDGNLLLRADPFRGVRLEDGAWVLPDRPGVGARPARAARSIQRP